MKERIFRSLAVAAFLALTPVIAEAQTSANASSAANASIIRGIGLARTQDLFFGDLFASAVAGTATVDPASVRTTAAGVTAAGGTVSAAAFVVSDTTTGNPKFYVQLPVSATITRAGGGATMTVTNFTANVAAGCVSLVAAPPPGPPGGCPNSNQNYVLNVGGQLNVAASQMTGSYTGTFLVSVHRF